MERVGGEAHHVVGVGDALDDGLVDRGAVGLCGGTVGGQVRPSVDGLRVLRGHLDDEAVEEGGVLQR